MREKYHKQIGENSEWAEDLERECNQRKADWNKACDEQGFLMLECDGHRAKATKLRETLQSVMDWNPKPEYWERPETVARFEADMAKARKVLEEAQETKPHHWEDRALTAERERDEALNVLREINDWINVAVMRPPTPNEAAYAINAWGDKIRPILEVTE